jgi:hypothetical protein
MGTDPVNPEESTERAGRLQRSGQDGRYTSRSRTGGKAGMNCQHMGCRCQAEQGEDFCGDYCREHAGNAVHEEHTCECGHDACTMAAV